MGDAEDPLAVVDGRLRVHGISRLHVCDASVMPSITSGNTNTPTLAVAMRLSEMLEVERKRTRTADILVSVVGQWKCNDLRGKLDKFIASNEAVLILEGLNPKERYIMHDLCTKQGVLSESEAKVRRPAHYVNTGGVLNGRSRDATCVASERLVQNARFARRDHHLWCTRAPLPLMYRWPL